MSAVFVVHTEDEYDHGRITLVGVRATLDEAQALASIEADQINLSNWHPGQYAEWRSWSNVAPGDSLTTYVITEQPLK